MARYISQASGFKKTGRHPEHELLTGPNGDYRQLRRPSIICLFQQGGVSPWENELATKRFGFRGIAEGENPLRRVSVYDTDEEAARNGWDAGTKADVEGMLDRGQSADYFRVELPRSPAPWPSYDQTDALRIADMAEAIGVDPQAVLIYERENLAREEVLGQVASLLVSEPDEVIVSA